VYFKFSPTPAAASSPAGGCIKRIFTTAVRVWNRWRGCKPCQRLEQRIFTTAVRVWYRWRGCKTLPAIATKEPFQPPQDL